MKPLLLGVSALFLGALAALLALCGTVLHAPAALPQALTLGALLLLARLLTVHRHRRAPALALGAAAATEAAALALPLAGRLPGCAVLATPVDTLVGAWGEAAVPAPRLRHRRPWPCCGTPAAPSPGPRPTRPPEHPSEPSATGPVHPPEASAPTPLKENTR